MKTKIERYTYWITHEFPEDMGKGLRVGQSYLNHVEPSVVYPELFYEEDPVKAWWLINDESRWKS